MRNFPDDLYWKAKEVAALLHMSMKDLIIACVREGIERRTRKPK